MVRGIEEERDEQAREGEGVGDDHDASRIAVVGGDELVVKEAGEEVADEDLEPATRAGGGVKRSLHGEREYGGFRWAEGGSLFRHG